MGKKKSEETGSAMKTKPSSKDTTSKDGKKEKLLASGILGNMDQKLDKPKKASTSLNKPKPKTAPKLSSYTEGIDLPPSDDDEEVVYAYDDENQQNGIPQKPSRQQRSEQKQLDRIY